MYPGPDRRTQSCTRVQNDLLRNFTLSRFYIIRSHKILLQRDSMPEANRILSRVKNQMGTACKSRTNVNLSAVHIRIV